jgi:hypothetical protein
MFNMPPMTTRVSPLCFGGVRNPTITPRSSALSPPALRRSKPLPLPSLTNGSSNNLLPPLPISFTNSNVLGLDVAPLKSSSNSKSALLPYSQYSPEEKRLRLLQDAEKAEGWAIAYLLDPKNTDLENRRRASSVLDLAERTKQRNTQKR